jgi:hypothetical protein
MKETNRWVIELEYPIRSLAWYGDDLVDWVSGGTRFSLSGETAKPRVFFAYRFDRGLTSIDGKCAVLYEVLGTKGLVVAGTKELRELNRSYYFANTYEYPVAVFALPDGSQALVHCPNRYNKLEVEELESGRPLTTRDGESTDFFHSRLQISPKGKYLLSAGWVWHPLDTIQVFCVSEVLKNPSILDRSCELELPESVYEIHAAAFQNDDVLLMTGDSADSEAPQPNLVAYSLEQSEILYVTKLESVLGTFMPLGNDYAVGFYEYPKLFELRSGKVVASWPELKSGLQNSSIIRHPIPPLALDPSHNRFAIAGEKQITVIELG